jgi:FtsP/CotA-like multicopper oxidase with cupredoxin domain
MIVHVPLIATLLSVPAADSSARVAPNDNRAPAGRLRHGVLTVQLDAALGTWSPEGEHGPRIVVAAFGERGRPVQIPGPLIRVPAGTELRFTVRNTLDLPLLVRGLYDRGAAQADSIDVAPGAVQEVRFRAVTPGTYYYWGRTSGTRSGPGRSDDSQLTGAIVVDSVQGGAGRPPRDRILVITTWVHPADTTLTTGERRELLGINGLSWPHTERFVLTTGDTVRWRVLNLSARIHPMHLHGFYFRVGSRGSAARDTVYSAAQQRHVVTEFMAPGTTMAMTWVPTRPGNWLFHCHLIAHISPVMRTQYARLSADSGAAAMHGANHAFESMAGLVVGIEVRPRRGGGDVAASAPQRALRLFVQKRAQYFSFVLQGDSMPPARDSIRIPGSPIVLRRGEPVAITLLNRTDELVSVHWHGIEVESFYDGVADWSGRAGHTAPRIAPGDSFVVHLTPDRAGTFIYHTHQDEGVQLLSGLYGPLVVLAPGEVYDSTTDHLFLIGRGGASVDAPVLFNGVTAPASVDWKAGVVHRLRFINITANDVEEATLTRDSTVQEWRLFAKDGAEVAAEQATAQPARLRMGPGETYDFEFTPSAPSDLTLLAVVRGRAGRTWQIRLPISVR